MRESGPARRKRRTSSSMSVVFPAPPGPQTPMTSRGRWAMRPALQRGVPARLQRMSVGFAFALCYRGQQSAKPMIDMRIRIGAGRRRATPRRLDERDHFLQRRSREKDPVNALLPH